MTEFSVVMRVSRLDDKFEKAFQSAINYKPDLLEVYMDTRKVSIHSMMDRVPHYSDRFTYYREFIYPTDNNSHNLHHNLHRMLFDSEFKWLCRLDDDDELIGSDRRKLIEEYGGDDVGIIYGNKVVQRGDQREVVKTKQIRHHQELRSAYAGGVVIFSGATVINRDAFRMIHPLCDHGWFADWKVWYWILRAGWRAVYVDEELMVQNVNPSPIGVRRSQYGTFPQYFDVMERIPVEMVEYVRGMDVERSREHLGFVKP